MNSYTFQNPEYLYLLILVPSIILYYFLRKKKTNLNILFSNVSAIKSRTYKNYLVHFNFFLQITALSLLIIAFARPQSTSSWENSTTTRRSGEVDATQETTTREEKSNMRYKICN